MSVTMEQIARVCFAGAQAAGEVDDTAGAVLGQVFAAMAAEAACLAPGASATAPQVMPGGTMPLPGADITSTEPVDLGGFIAAYGDYIRSGGAGQGEEFKAWVARRQTQHRDGAPDVTEVTVTLRRFLSASTSTLAEAVALLSSAERSMFGQALGDPPGGERTRVFEVPWPMDKHPNGTIYIRAATPARALQLAREWHARAKNQHGFAQQHEPAWGDVSVMTSGPVWWAG